MARFEGKFEADGGEPIELDQLFGLIRASAPDRLEAARACYLSSSDGWRKAVKLIGGAFAEVNPAEETKKK